MRIVATRLFTVYGPRQRPDLAIHKFCRAIMAGRPIPLFGDGSTRRDYTYVSDIVSGLRGSLGWTLSGTQEGTDWEPERRNAGTPAFEIANLGGARTTSLIELVRHLERLLDRPAILDWQPAQPGDVPITYADTRRARALFGYQPRVAIEDGLARFVEWFRAQHNENC
jgi:UDP-glucuronate 4-epimerase